MPDAAGLRMLARPDRLQVGPWEVVFFIRWRCWWGASICSPARQAAGGAVEVGLFLCICDEDDVAREEGKEPETPGSSNAARLPAQGKAPGHSILQT